MIWPVSSLGNAQCHYSISKKFFPLSTILKAVEHMIARYSVGKEGGEIWCVGNFIGEICAPRKLRKMCMSAGG